MPQLTLSLIQTDLHWENKILNLQMFEEKISLVPATSQVVLLPEMFSTGFSMQPEKLSEGMDGKTVQWMQKVSDKQKKIICGSIIVEEEGKYFNRLLWVLPNGVVYHYDKRHLFGFAGEDKHYSPGDSRLIVQVNGIKLCLMVCYDLRFPVWARQDKDPYDMLIYVANWPQRRSHAWNTLLQARAIENQSYVAGINRVGNDGNNIYHSGDSAVIDPLGNVLWQEADKEAIFTFTLVKEELDDVRARFPFLNDRDSFMML